VRKSFLKHYIVAYLKQREEFVKLDLTSMMFDNYEETIGNGLVITRNRFEDWVDENKEEFFNKTGLTKEDFRLDNKENLDPVLYQSALFDTIKETMQATEALMHNLNTLQSRSGGQLPFSSINYGTCTRINHCTSNFNSSITRNYKWYCNFLVGFYTSNNRNWYIVTYIFN
jgi:ribonucleoside-triphosphate reductase